MSELLQTTQDEAIATLTLNRPAQRNALSRDLMSALQNAFDVIANDKRIKVVVLAANGPGFCAGHDLREMTAARTQNDRGREFFAATMRECSALMQTIVTLPQPVIARVHGIATAAGCQLVASCDLAIATTDARFATPGVNIGLFCSTPMVALSRNVARKHAMEMLLTGEMISASRAAELGLINRVVSADQIESEVAALAALIASKSGHALKIGKRAFYEQLEMPMSEAYEFASRVMVENMLAHDAEEGINAFLEKRSPQWQDR